MATKFKGNRRLQGNGKVIQGNLPYNKAADLQGSQDNTMGKMLQGSKSKQNSLKAQPANKIAGQLTGYKKTRMSNLANKFFGR